jgi:hypothetical protein
MRECANAASSSLLDKGCGAGLQELVAVVRTILA